jgi:hypothetical protein
MHNDIEIITIRRTKGGGRDAPNCSVTLAFVDFRVSGLMIFGASIVRSVDGTIHICAPRNDRSTGHATGAGFADKQLKAAVLERAKAAFVALGGKLEAAPAEVAAGEEAEGVLRFVSGRA